MTMNKHIVSKLLLAINILIGIFCFIESRTDYKYSSGSLMAIFIIFTMGSYIYLIRNCTYTKSSITITALITLLWEVLYYI